MHILQLLLQIAIILFLSRVLARLLRKLNQPSVIAEIIAGVALGPSILGAISPEALSLLFPSDSFAVLGTISQLGLVFFMFLVGLEFDPKLLQGQARSSVAVSHTGIFLPLGLGVGLAVPLHPILAPEGVSFLPFALFLGTAMSVTAFPVLARILSERRLIKTRVGAIALAAAAVDDVTAWCLLAFVVGIASAGGLTAAFTTTALAGAYSAFIWFAVRPVLRRVGPRQGQRLSTDVVAFVLLLVVLSSAATEWIGIHALFGAFLLGAAMPRDGGLPAAMVEKMEDFVTVVLLPVFFAYSGLRTELQLISGPSDWVMCAGIVAVATVGKFGGSAVAGRLTGLGWRESVALGILMNTRGLMELVVLNVGLDLGVISPRLFAMMVIMALVTTWIAAPLLARLYPLSQGLAKLPSLSMPPPAMPGPLICVADPATARSLVRLARVWIGGHDAQAWALHLRPTDRPHEYLRGERPEIEDDPLQEVARFAREERLDYEPLAFPSASPAADIVQVAEMKGVPLILLGIHRSTLGQDTLGGVVGSVLRDAEPAVAVLVDRGVGELRRVALRDSVSPHQRAARALLKRLTLSGVSLVGEDDPEVDLIVTAWDPDITIPPEDEPSCVFVRAAREG